MNQTLLFWQSVSVSIGVPIVVVLIGKWYDRRTAGDRVTVDDRQQLVVTAMEQAARDRQRADDCEERRKRDEAACEEEYEKIRKRCDEEIKWLQEKNNNLEHTMAKVAGESYLAQRLADGLLNRVLGTEYETDARRVELSTAKLAELSVRPSSEPPIRGGIGG
jgi:hypothetical protein